PLRRLRRTREQPVLLGERGGSGTSKCGDARSRRRGRTSRGALRHRREPHSDCAMKHLPIAFIVASAACCCVPEDRSSSTRSPGGGHTSAGGAVAALGGARGEGGAVATGGARAPADPPSPDCSASPHVPVVEDCT